MTTTLALTPLSGHFAARIDTPFDKLLDEASHQALRDALVEHKVLVLPGADPSIEQHIALATVFGDAEPPQPQNPRHEDSDLVCVFDSAEGYKADRWHADETFTDTPSSGAALVMRMKPDVGGDTLWLDTEAAHDALSNGMRTLLANRRARHEIAPGVAAEHPVIRHHPVSGRPCLFVNETFVRGIVNLPPIESEAVLAMLSSTLPAPISPTGIGGRKAMSSSGTTAAPSTSPWPTSPAAELSTGSVSSPNPSPPERIVMQQPPVDPFLAPSGNAMAHGRSDQQDNVPWAGPEGPSEVLDADSVQYTWLTPCHFGCMISGPYPDGRRVIWSNGRQTINKLDYDTLEILAEHVIEGGEGKTPQAELEDNLRGLDEKEGWEAIEHAIGLSLKYMTGLDGVYALVDCDNTFFLGRKDHAVAYVDSDPTDPASAIVERDRWYKPDHIEGFFVGINITFDGWLVMTTDHGWVVLLKRDFSEYRAIQIRGGAQDAAAYCAAKAEDYGHTGFGWVRTSTCVDDDNSIYLSSCDHHHKVVWDGERLSIDEADGAWSFPYRNGAQNGSGTTPSLMGFGPDEDHFVVFGDGDEVVNITYAWRDEIPDDWEQLPDAPSRRIAGLGPANMGDPDLPAIQTEQSITVSGYGAMTVNNEPAMLPDGIPVRGKRLLCFMLGHKPEYTPHGLHKYEWNPVERRLDEAWVNNDVSSPNSVPFVAQASDLVYTCGSRDGMWTIEAVNWSTGESAFHYVLGGSKFNTLGAGVTVDDDGRILYGTMYGKVRILR